MSRTVIAAARRLLATAWLAALVCCIAVAAIARFADVVVIRGGSMEPAIPRGSIVALDDGSATAIRAGDVVTVRADNGVLVTHRVERVLELADGKFLELRGDANHGPDPVLAPAGSLVGRVAWTAPYVGYLVAFLSMPVGFLSVLSFLGAGALAIWYLEDVEASRRRSTVSV